MKKGFDVMKRKVSLLLALIFVLSSIFSVKVFAVNYPSISSGKYIEFKAQQNINVYKDTKCKTRGTSSPSKAYNASISSGDTCYIYKITNDYIQVNYPTSSGRRTGYIKRSSLFDKTAPTDYISSSKAKVTVHKSSSGSYIAKGDKVWVVDAKKGYSNYTSVIYEAKSGKRAYKLGYVTNNDFNMIKKGNSNDLTKIEFLKIEKEEMKSLLNSQKSVAKSVLDFVNTINLRSAVMEVVGTGTVAVATWNPAKLLDVLGADSVVGLTSFLISEKYFKEAETAHKEFDSLINKVSTTKQANAAFEAFVEALSKYNAVENANIDTVTRYTQKGNYKKDMLVKYLSSVATSVLPESKFDAVIDAYDTYSTMTDVLNTVDSKYAGYEAMLMTVYNWQTKWSRLK